MNFFKSFTGKPQDRNGIITPKTEDELVASRRDFLKGAGKLMASATITNVGLGFLSEEVQAKDEFSAFQNNEIGKRRFMEFLNNKNIPHILTNPKANDVDIYNDLEKIMKDWHAGNFQRNESKYYKPKSFDNLKAQTKKYNGDELKFLAGESLRKINLKTDYLSVGEIQGSNSEDLITKGFIVLKKGTELYTREVNGVKQTYIAECFNKLYTGQPLCSPCPEGVTCKK